MTPDDAIYAESAATLLADIADALLGRPDWSLLARLQAALVPEPTLKSADLRPDPGTLKELMEKGLYAPITSDKIREAMKSIWDDKIHEQLSSQADSPPMNPEIGSVWIETGPSTTSNPAVWSYSVDRQKGKRKGKRR